MTARICVSILPKNIAEASELIRKAQNFKADFVEVRLDCFEDYGTLDDIAKHTHTSLIATNRSEDCQGKFLGSETKRQKILLDAAEKGFEYVDIELSCPKLKNIVRSLHQLNVKPIISFHDFDGTPGPSELHEIFEREIASGAEVCKITTTARCVEDNLAMLDFACKASKTAKTVCFCMGELGRPSRLLSSFFGAFFTIASLERGKETAPGQLTFQEMSTIYRALGLR